MSDMECLLPGNDALAAPTPTPICEYSHFGSSESCPRFLRALRVLFSRAIDMNLLVVQSLVHICPVSLSCLLPSKSLVEFPARECSLKNNVPIAIKHKWHHVNVFVNRHYKHPLPSAFRMLDNIQILFLQNQHGNFIERDSSFRLKLCALFFIPDYIHGIKISHYVHNVNYLFASAAPAPNKRQHGARTLDRRR